MRILITGSNGQVGRALAETLVDHDLILLTRKDCNLNNLDRIRYNIDFIKPDLIINAAAYTKVDQAEDEKKLVYQINYDAPKVMAEKALERKIPFIHFSTDYVFDGKKGSAYIESDSTNPLGVYGKSKLAGDEAIQDIGGQFYILRTSWVYSNVGRNFYRTITKISQAENQLRIVSDQFGVPTSSKFISEVIKKIIKQLSHSNTGIYHLVPDGQCSWYDFAREIIIKNNPKFNINNLIPIITRDFPTKAKRPLNSVLDNKHIQTVFMLKFDNWQSVLNKL